MKRFVIALCMGLCLVAGGVLAQDPPGVDQLENKIKSSSSEDLRNYARELHRASSERVSRLNPQWSELDIYVNHHVSLIREALYHMEKIAPYYRYEEALELKKLKALKRNRQRFEEGEITEEAYRHNIERIKRQYEKDLKETREFLAYKIDRLRGICDALKANEEAMRDLFPDRDIPDWAREKILSFKESDTWIAFWNHSPKGEKIRRVLETGPGGGSGLVACLEEIFVPFEEVSGTVFSEELVERVVAQYE